MAVVTCPRCGFGGEVLGEAATAFVPLRVPSANDRITNAAAKTWAYKKQRDSWWTAFRAMRLSGQVTRATGKRYVAFTRVYSGREREWDYDNLVGGMKLVVDAMRKEELLVDDNPKWLVATYRQERGEQSGLRVMVTQVLAPLGEGG